MAAYSEDFPWLSYYGQYDFFEDRMEEHSNVKAITKISPSLFTITLHNDTELKVFVCECYSYGMAEYYETVENLGNVDIIIISSLWCSYTGDVRYQCYLKGVGVFNIKGFMGALNAQNPCKYLTKGEKEYYKEQGLKI